MPIAVRRGPAGQRPEAAGWRARAAQETDGPSACRPPRPPKNAASAEERQRQATAAARRPGRAAAAPARPSENAPEGRRAPRSHGEGRSSWSTPSSSRTCIPRPAGPGLRGDLRGDPRRPGRASHALSAEGRPPVRACSPTGFAPASFAALVLHLGLHQFRSARTPRRNSPVAIENAAPRRGRPARSAPTGVRGDPPARAHAADQRERW